MKTAVINIKTEPLLKSQAHSAANDLGLSLSALINSFLKQLVYTRSITLDAQPEIPTDYMLSVVRDAQNDRKNGKTSRVYVSSKSGISWLRDKGDMK